MFPLKKKINLWANKLNSIFWQLSLLGCRTKTEILSNEISCLFQS